MLLLMGREDFVTSLGGPDAPAGTNGLTVGQLADRLEAAVVRLTTPGHRVHLPRDNRERFWRDVSGDI